MNILVVEDVRVARKLLAGLLESWGTVAEAEDGEQALDLFHEAEASGHPFDLVCIDIELPDMTGLEILDAIRRSDLLEDRLAMEVKILMVTSSSSGKNVMESFRRLADGYLVKPVSKQGIEEHMTKLGFQRRAA